MSCYSLSTFGRKTMMFITMIAVIAIGNQSSKSYDLIDKNGFTITTKPTHHEKCVYS